MSSTTKLETGTSSFKTLEAYKQAATQIGLVLKPGDGLNSGDYPHDALIQRTSRIFKKGLN